jgi:hypothetical protein
LLATIFALTFFKGVRLPSLWAATHFAFNYSQGFVRRGFVGEVARRLFGDDVYTYKNFLGFSCLVFTLCALLLGRNIVQALRAAPQDLALRLALLAFAASPALVFFVHMLGYFDNLGLLLVLGFLWAAERINNRFVPAILVALVGVVLVLIHEGLVIIFVPTLTFVLLCHAVRAHRLAAFKRWDWAILGVEAALAIAPILIVAIVLSRSGGHDADRVQALTKFMHRHVDFPIRSDAVETLTRSSEENMRRIIPWYWRQPESQQRAAQDFSAFLPGLGVLIYYAATMLRRLALPRALFVVLLLGFIAATFAPEFMNFAGWDWPRWNGLTLINCVVALLSLLVLLRPEPARVGPNFIAAAGVATAIALASNTFLFDDYRVQYFPFGKQFELIERLFREDFKTRPPG